MLIHVSTWDLRCHLITHSQVAHTVQIVAWLCIKHPDAVFSRTIPDESICDPNNNGESTLVALRLENNYIDPQKISPTAFSCVRASSSVVLKPQKTQLQKKAKY